MKNRGLLYKEIKKPGGMPGLASMRKTNDVFTSFRV